MSSAIAAVAEQQIYPYFTEEHAMLRETVKQFCLKEIAPHAEEWDEEGIFPRELFKTKEPFVAFHLIPLLPRCPRESFPARSPQR